MKMNSKSFWKPSRFNMWIKCEDETLLVYNSLSGALLKFDSTVADYIASILVSRSIEEPKGILSQLADQSLIIPRSIKELELLRRLSESYFERDDRLNLILMPTENCNFRCVYCYEEFKPKRMSCEVIDSIIQLVQQKAKLRNLSIMWFGGEPLTAFDIIQRISHKLLAICKERQIEYSASISTNGYLLTDQLVEQCFSAQISKFQITLDGPAETHDKLRVLFSGDGTFNKIIANLRNLRNKKKDFQVRIRVNFIPDMISHLPKFLRFMKSEFAGDSRFSFYFRPVADLSRVQNNSVKMCDHKTAMGHEIRLMSLALQEGFSLDSWKESMQFFGSVCYAADPYSFVIRPDGGIYKCTVAFDDPRNQIGRISPDGSMTINEELYRLWTLPWKELDADCRKCSFLPACQGNRCPLETLNQGDKTCPIVKTHLDVCLPLLATESINSLEDRGMLNA